MANVARKYLGHWIDDTFGESTANYFRIGKDLEEFNEELNPDIETTKNILGQTSIKHNGYEVSGSVEPYYYATGETLATVVEGIANGRKTGEECETTIIDVIFGEPAQSTDTTMTIVKAYKETVTVVPQSIGGDTSGIQIPFELHYHGDRTDVTSKVSIDADDGELHYTP